MAEDREGTLGRLIDNLETFNEAETTIHIERKLATITTEMSGKGTSSPKPDPVRKDNARG